MLHVDAGLIVIFVVVWILVVMLNKVYFRPLRRVMNQRNREITDNQKASQQALEGYEQTLGKIKEDIQTAKSSARTTREALEREALKEKERLLAEISKECRSNVEKAKKELDQQVARLKKELEPQSEKIAGRIEKRLLF
jgi:F-type H+-transporting ATPase subunit b